MRIHKGDVEISALEEWHRHARPQRKNQWAPGRSAMCMAETWLESAPPAPVLGLLEAHEDFSGLDFERSDAEPECEIPLTDAELGAGLAAHGLQSGWFDILAALRRAGARYELNPTELMRATLLSSGGMTKRLDRMADEGLVERWPDPADRRGTRVRLTARGREVIDRALEAHIKNEARLVASLTDAERKRLDGLLRKVLLELEARRAGGEAGETE